MRSRHDVIEVFSTYIRFEADRFNGWLQDGQLRRSMENFVASVSEQKATEKVAKNALAAYWHKQWKDQKNRLAMVHLLAYLQESGYWAAYHYTSRFQNKTQDMSLADCFQVATEKVPNILEQFQPERGVALDAFAKRFFRSTIANKLRLRSAINVCSDWSFLRRLTKVKLTEALENRGLSKSEVAQYLLVWKCFNRLYAPPPQQGITQLPEPDSEKLEEISALYNKERISQLPAPAPKIDKATVRQQLHDCIKWGRAYLYPTIGSLDVPKPGYSSGSLQDDLPGEQVVSLVDSLIATEMLQQRQQQRQQLGNAMNAAIKNLKEPGEVLLQLSYQEGLKQREIADKLGIKQFTISRKLSRARKDLLKSIVQWSQDTLEVTPTPNSIAQMESLIEEWLEEQYANR